MDLEKFMPLAEFVEQFETPFDCIQGLLEHQPVGVLKPFYSAADGAPYVNRVEAVDWISLWFLENDEEGDEEENVMATD